MIGGRRGPAVRAMESCPHRDPSGPSCRLVAEITGAELLETVAVGADTCLACCAGPVPEVRRPGPVVASLVSRAAEVAVRTGGVPGLDAARAEELRRWAHDHVLAVSVASSGSGPAQVEAVGRPLPTAAIVIPCHNYGRFLGEAIESALAQTVPPDEILVFDDASDDDTAEVALRYQSSGVEYHRVEFRSIYRVRRAGLAATGSEILCFLDADDRLPPDYLERGLPLFDRSEVGIAYPDLDYFGAASGRRSFPDFDRGELELRNYMPAASLVRRRALEIADAFREPDAPDALEDWLVWRRVIDAGWRGVKHPGAVRYQRHPAGEPSMSDRKIGNPYFVEAGLAHTDVTIVTPLAGRAAFWPEYRDWLAAQTWPRQRSQVFLVDTSADAQFGRAVREFLASCDYPATRYLALSVAEPGLADRPRRKVVGAVNLACARIYNRVAREVTTPFVLIVEDDILPPAGVIERLLFAMDARTAAVGAPYRSRFHDAYVAWDDRARNFYGGEGVHAIGGCGFGCVLVRRAALAPDTLLFGYAEHIWFDHAFCNRLRRGGWTIKIDWTQECLHREQLRTEAP